ncbi:MAG: tRNA lysidine(34) synthetase TilS, partial [Saprospiraceae bacterium]|nr:tRNA lysidine(34) synthetase TilS [Saprospiraceae bacterium]
LKAFVAKHELFEPADRILLAVSGGMDSMCMLHLLRRTGQPCEVVHVNYHLRGADSERDAKLVASYCSRYNVPFHLKDAPIPDQANVQISARELRYAWFETLLRQHHFRAVATAHHLDDTIETFFINLLRGTGIDGLTGIPVRRDGIVRPMLCFDRHTIQAIVKAEKIPFAHDITNDEKYYLRNRIRADLMPVLIDLKPDFRERMRDTITHLEGQAALIRNALQRQVEGLVVCDGEMLSLPLGALQATPAPILVLHHLAGRYGFTVHQCTEALQTEHQAGTQFLSATHVMTVDRDSLLITRQQEVKVRPQTISPGETIILPHGKIMLSELPEGEVWSRDPHEEAFSGDLCRDRLVVRQWKAGDRFHPLGAPGRQKVQDFLTDRKVPRPLKAQVLVLTCGDEIVWLVGHRLDERYKVTPATQRLLRVRWVPAEARG